MEGATFVRKVGRYEILRQIGRGATSIVYLARQTDLDRNVALKELAAFHAADPAFVERFLRESKLTGSLNHPNIVTVHEYFELDGTAYIAMEYFERGSLRPLVGRLTRAQTVGVLESVLSGLAHAEARGVVHRDLKPENLMVTVEGNVKIADFGIAKALEAGGSASLTETGATVGTPAMAARITNDTSENLTTVETRPCALNIRSPLFLTHGADSCTSSRVPGIKSIRFSSTRGFQD